MAVIERCLRTPGTGRLRVAPAANALLELSERFEVVFSLTDAEGQVCQARAESIDVETLAKVDDADAVVSVGRPTSFAQWSSRASRTD
mgnify:CR=1 FL=1